jgi:DNA-binding NtrC family response regulator
MRVLMEEKLKVLIVDDETDVCFLLSSILKYRNLRASYVNTISEAKNALMKDNPSIIFLDNHLPDGFGMNFIEEIKKLYPHVKIVMITAHDTATDKENAYRKGVDSFIGKPFTKDIILNELELLLN